MQKAASAGASVDMAKVSRFLSLSSLAVTVTMIAPILWSMFERDGTTLYFIASFIIGLLFSTFLGFYGSIANLSDLSIRETTISVVLSWIAASVIVALPYYFTGVAESFIDALFEGVSGFTTTGATIISDLEKVPRSVLFWRCFSQWIGGMGVIILTLAAVPISRAGMQLYKAEVSGPVHERLTPRIRETAIFIWKVYLSLTTLQIFLLMIGGLSFFDASTLSFSTIATGGFSPYSRNVGHFDSSYVIWVTSIFLLLAASNLAFYHVLIVKRSITQLKQNVEMKFYIKTLLLFGILMSLVLHGNGVLKSYASSLRVGFFHTVSTLSTCGFFISNYNVWPSSAKYLLLVLMFIGGCATSTAGGITCMRIVVILRHVRDEFWRLLHPRAIIPTSYGDVPLEAHIVSSCFAYFTAYIGILATAFVLLASCGQDLITAFSGAVATLGNVGPGMGMIGPKYGYAAQPATVKSIYMLLMFCGRLEIFTLTLLLSRRFWRK